jgi:transcriptional regulator with XRE-family HTH domain
MAVIMRHCYDKRINRAIGKTISVADGAISFDYAAGMLSSRELLDLLDARGVAQADMARALKLPSSRISEMYAGKRQVKQDEAKRLVEAFHVDEGASVPPISEQTARLLILHVANTLGQPLSPNDQLVQELALDFQAFSKFARAHLPAPSPEATAGFLYARRADRPAPKRATPRPHQNH